jgi:hypothetical protein
MTTTATDDIQQSQRGPGCPWHTPQLTKPIQRDHLHIEPQILDVGELHFPSTGPSAAIAELHLVKGLPDEGAQLLFAGADVLGVEKAGHVVQGQGGAFP